MRQRPWSSGPAELLNHGLGHLSTEDSDLNRRLAILSIDNSVEVMLRTYLSLPSRETGIRVSRSELREMGESFPKLLERIEELAPDRLEGVDPSAVEYFHRLRNQLYHEGNGLTVERDNVATYATLAKIMFKNLFGTELPSTVDVEGSEMISEYLKAFEELRELLLELAEYKFDPKGTNPKRIRMPTTGELIEWGILDEEMAAQLTALQDIRKRVAHGQAASLTWRDLNALHRLNTYLMDRI